jgi:competence protein ComEC
LRRNTAISLIAAGLIAGLALGRAGLSAGLWLPGLCALAAAALVRTRLFVLVLALTALTLGLWRAAGWAGEQAQLSGLIGQTVTVEGTVSDDPAVGPTRQLDFKLADITLDGGRLPGTLSVHEYPSQLQRGYRVRLTGKVGPGFGNAVAELGFPKLEVLTSAQGPLERLRQHFFTGVRTALPEPLASFGLGLLVGIRALIPKPMQAQLALVGLSHLVAVSGYNLTIIVRAAHRLLERFGRGIALAASLWLIGGFIVVTGAGASIVRAALVSVLSLLAAFYGRRFQPLALILIAAAATAAWSPAYLTDLGWLLSFLAFFGILVLAPAVEARLGNPKPVIIRLFIESFAAQILTLPLILCVFGQLSIVAPLTNLLILPMVPFAMAAAFAAGLAGMLIPPFAGWFAWPATLVLGFITKLIGAFAALPFAGATSYITFSAMLAMYALILIVCVILTRSARRRGQTPSARHLLEPVAQVR